MLALIHDTTTRVDRDAPRPTPGEGDALIAVRCAGICATDLEITRGYMNFRGILGHEFVGAVMDGPPALKGKRVAGEINCVCGRCDMCTSGLASHCRRRTVVGIDGRAGAFAEYLVIPAANCHVLPDSVSDEEAVFVEPLAAAFQITRQVKIEPRTRVMVLGSGRLGLLVAQVLSLTHCRLAVLGRNPRTLGLLDRKGIQTMTAADVTRGADQDVVVDCTGSPDGLPLAMRLIRPRGTIVMKTTCAGAAPVNLAPLVVNEVTLLGSRCGPFPDAITALAARQVDVKSLISRVMPLAQGVEALAEAGRPENIKVLLKV